MRTLLLAVCIVACGPPAKPTTPRLATATSQENTEVLDPYRARPTRKQSIQYQINGRKFPLPIVMGTIAGQPVPMLVDTGANAHVIAGWMARKLGLSMKKLGDMGTDHVGKTIAAYRIDKPDMVLDEWGPLEAGPVLATEVPEFIEKLGIGAFISPQRLVEDGDAVVFDLKKKELRAVWWDEALYSLSAKGVPLVLGDGGRACQELDGPIKGLSFVVPATVEGFRTSLLVDTGAQHSDVFVGSNAGQNLAERSVANKEPMYTAAGKISARRINGAIVTAGSFTMKSDVDLIAGAADESCPRDGVLAMDVLHNCTLLLGRTRFWATCIEK